MHHAPVIGREWDVYAMIGGEGKRKNGTKWIMEQIKGRKKDDGEVEELEDEETERKARKREKM